MGIVGGGGQAELAVVHERVLMAVPERLSWPEAGGTPEVFTTAHDALFTQAGLRAGERLLVHGGAGGVGTAAIQLGRAAGARVTATVRNPDLRDRVAELGAYVIEPDAFAEHGPYDVILELVGAANLPGNLAALELLGRITMIGIGAGAKAEVNLGLLMAKRARIHGSMLRARPIEEKALTARAMERSVLPLLAARRRAGADRRRRTRSARRPRPTNAFRPAASSARSCSRCASDRRGRRGESASRPGRLNRRHRSSREPGAGPSCERLCRSSTSRGTSAGPSSIGLRAQPCVSFAPHSSQRSPHVSSGLLLEVHSGRV